MKNLLAVIIFWFCQDTNLYRIFSAFTSRRTSLPDRNGASPVFLCDVYIFAQFINFVSIEQELMGSVKLTTRDKLHIYLIHPTLMIMQLSDFFSVVALEW